MKLFSFYRALSGLKIKVTYKSQEQGQKSILVSHVGKMHFHVPKLITPESKRMAFSIRILFL